MPASKAPSENNPAPEIQPVRLAAVGDLHCTLKSGPKLAAIFDNLPQRAEVLLLCGDLTDLGKPREMEILIAALRPSIEAGLVVLAVLGNHDYQNGQQSVLAAMLREAGGRVLFGDDNIFVLNERVGFVGVRGFWGGFAPNTLHGFGEEISKQVVKETVKDVRRLAKGLRSLSTPQKIALLHYAPIKDTLRGEPAELMPILGSEWLAKPLDEEHATMCFHGHSHQGSYNGLTKAGVPVYNVAAPVLRRTGLQIPSIHLV